MVAHLIPSAKRGGRKREVDVPIRLAKIRLRMTWTMAQRHEHLPRPQHLRRSILPHDRVAAAKALFVPQPLENPMRRENWETVNVSSLRDTVCERPNEELSVLRSTKMDRYFQSPTGARQITCAMSSCASGGR
jgi:hypothetical protein